MWDQLLAGLLFLFGFKYDIPSVRGEATASSQSALIATNATSSSTAAKNVLKPSVLNFKQSLETREAQFIQNMEQKRLETVKINQEKKTAFLKKLTEIKDERKKETLQMIQEKMTTINTNRTTVMTKHLTTMSAILKTISEKAQASGKDTTKISVAIAAAEKAISDAMTALTTQAGKTYTITITSETKVKGDVDAAKKLLETDLKSVQDKVKTARELVSKAVMEFRLLTGNTQPSGSISPPIAPRISVMATPTPTSSILITATPKISSAVQGTGTPTVTPTMSIR